MSWGVGQQTGETHVFELVRAGEIDGQAALGPSWRGHVAACLHQRQRRHRALALTCVVQRRHAVFVPLVDLGPAGSHPTSYKHVVGIGSSKLEASTNFR